MHNDQVGSQVWFNISKLITVIHHINSKGKNSVISVHTEKKTFAKIQHHFMINSSIILIIKNGIIIWQAKC